MSDQGFEPTEDGGRNSLHLKNVFGHGLLGLDGRIHPEVPQCDLDDLLENDGGQDLASGGPVP